MKRSYREVVNTVAAQLLTWVPLLVLLGIGPSAATLNAVIPAIAAAIGGVVWFIGQAKHASNKVDDTGHLPKPEAFWSLVTGKISNRARSLAGIGQIVVVVPAGARTEGAMLESAYGEGTNQSPLIFVPLPDANDKDKDARISYLKTLLGKEDDEETFAVVVVDDGRWHLEGEVESLIREWGRRNPEKPIVSVLSSGVGTASGLPASINFNSVPINAVVRPPYAALTNRLLQQTANRGESWKQHASFSRMVVGGTLAVTIACAAFAVEISRATLSRERARASTLAATRDSLKHFRKSSEVPGALRAGMLVSAASVRRNTPISALEAHRQLLVKEVDALREALINAHGGQPQNTTIVLLSLQDGTGPRGKRVVEIGRAPSDNAIRQPFPLMEGAAQIDGIAPCAIATGIAVHWRGKATSFTDQTDSLAAWLVSGEPAGQYSHLTLPKSC